MSCAWSDEEILQAWKAILDVVLTPILVVVASAAVAIFAAQCVYEDRVAELESHHADDVELQYERWPDPGELRLEDDPTATPTPTPTPDGMMEL